MEVLFEVEKLDMASKAAELLDRVQRPSLISAKKSNEMESFETSTATRQYSTLCYSSGMTIVTRIGRLSRHPLRQIYKGQPNDKVRPAELFLSRAALVSQNIL